MANFTSNTYILKRKILTFIKKLQHSFRDPKRNLSLTSLMEC